METKLSQPDAKVLHFEKFLMLFKFKINLTYEHLQKTITFQQCCKTVNLGLINSFLGQMNTLKFQKTTPLIQYINIQVLNAYFKHVFIFFIIQANHLITYYIKIGTIQCTALQIVFN